MACSLPLAPPSQLLTLVGEQEHGRTIPLRDIAPHRRGAEAHTLRRCSDTSERQRLELLGEL
jgi:hypothetical protein